MPALSPRSVVVTGAAGRIGVRIAKRLAADGWHVVAMDTDEGRLAWAHDVPGITPLHGDITREEDLDWAVEAASRSSHLAAWINNAMISALGRLDELDRDTIERGIAVNLTATILGAQRAVRAFLASGVPGSIVNISSVHASVSYPSFAIYDATKGAVEAFTRYLCVEYGHRGIRSNAIAPGAVVTEEMLNDSSAAGIQLLDEMRAFSPMGALIPASRIAAVAAFLLSDDALEICGHVLTVDGGLRSRCFPFAPDPQIPVTPAGA